LLEFDISGAGCSEVQPGLPVEQVITGSVEVGDLRQGDYCLSTADITLKGGQSTAYEAPRATRRRLREYWFRLTGEKGIGWDLGLSMPVAMMKNINRRSALIAIRFRYSEPVLLLSGPKNVNTR